MKPWLIALRLLRQNRWLYLVLVLSPFGLAALLVFSGAPLDNGDILAVLHQECIYGLALVIFTGSAQLGNEQRSRRIATVLARAVSRREYLRALLLAAYLPLVPYMLSFAIAAGMLVRTTPAIVTVPVAMAVAQLFLGLWLAAASVFYAVLLPQILASTATLATLAAVIALGQIAPQFLLGRLLLMLTQGSLIDEAGMLRQHPAWLLAPLVAAAVFYFGAAGFFERRDLNLTTD